MRSSAIKPSGLLVGPPCVRSESGEFFENSLEPRESVVLCVFIGMCCAERFCNVLVIKLL